jgi:hypothetical protein
VSGLGVLGPTRGGVVVSEALELSAARSFLKLNTAGTPSASCSDGDEASTFSPALLEFCMSSSLSTLFISTMFIICFCDCFVGDADSENVSEVRMDIPDCLIFSCAAAATLFRIKSIGVCAGDALGACMDVRGVIEASSFAATFDFVAGDCSVMMFP